MTNPFSTLTRGLNRRCRSLLALAFLSVTACGEHRSYVGGYCAENASVRMIDDMEAGDWRFSSPGIEGYWQCAWDADSPGAKAPKLCRSTNNESLPAQPAAGETDAPEKVPPRPGSHYARHAVGEPSTGWGASIGLDFDNRKGFDASPWTGVHFYARSNTPGGDRLRMHIPDWNTSPQGNCHPTSNGSGCNRNFGAELPLTEEWTEYSYYWPDLSQPDSSVIAGDEFPALDMTRIIGLRFQIDGEGDPSARSVPAYDFWIDDVSFLCGAKSSN
jgi:hypothetical protein